MKVAQWVVGALLSVVAGVGATPAHAAQPGAVRYVVGVGADVGVAEAQALLRAAGGEARRPVTGVFAHRVSIRLARRDAFVAALRRDPRVRYVELDRAVRLPPSELPRATGDTAEGLTRSARTAERDVAGKVRRSPATPKCARVAVVDTGVDLDHPALRGRVALNRAETRGNGRDDDHNGYVDDYGGYDAHGGRGDAEDTNGHGTHVVGIIAAANNGKRRAVGLCRTAQVIPVRFMDSQGLGTTSGSAEAIVYAVQAGATVINCSYTTSTRTQVEYDALAFARSRGVLVVAAAGNAGNDNDRVPVYPAAHPLDNVVAVAASSYDNIGLAPFSNWGRRTVALAAAGSGINSTWLRGGYRSMSGTSMAAPAVAAAAAAIKARRGWKYGKLRAQILSTVSRHATLRDRTTTTGRLNFERAVNTS
ncbi:S8 family serine peptidase [Solirubrobacter taibaiensis]|nr:S8 family serine peptidase [Solirubrobacter taibaiensis]